MLAELQLSTLVAGIGMLYTGDLGCYLFYRLPRKLSQSVDNGISIGAASNLVRVFAL